MKKTLGQFYTTQCHLILDGFDKPPPGARIVEPFAGTGELIDWIGRSVESYDIEPKRSDIKQRDTLTNPPNYTGAWIVTNPPYLARNKSQSKTLFDRYDTNDLYKCFIMSCLECVGGIFIIPVGFFLSIDSKCRNEFMKRFKITKMRYFEEPVFDDTTTSVVAFSFIRSEQVLSEQFVEWEAIPSGQKRIFHIEAEYNWVIGGDIYRLPRSNVRVSRFVQGKPVPDGMHTTFITLNALDSGKRIGLEYKRGFIYPAKDCSRTYATLCISGRQLSDDEQVRICNQFNEYLEKKRTETWSLFLPQFRESTRRRIPFELAYQIVGRFVEAMENIHQ